jgi:hypothetical protein
MTYPETLNTKIATNKRSFPLVIQTVHSDARFDSYGILKLGQGAKNFLDRLETPANDQVLRLEDARILARVVYKFRIPLTQLSSAYSYAHFLKPQQQLQPFEYSYVRSSADCRKMES